MFIDHLEVTNNFSTRLLW